MSIKLYILEEGPPYSNDNKRSNDRKDETFGWIS